MAGVRKKKVDLELSRRVDRVGAARPLAAVEQIPHHAIPNLRAGDRLHHPLVPLDAVRDDNLAALVEPEEATAVEGVHKDARRARRLARREQKMAFGGVGGRGGG